MQMKAGRCCAFVMFFASAEAQQTDFASSQMNRPWGGAVVCPSVGKCRICNCIRTRIFDPCNPPELEGFQAQMFGGCSPECQGLACEDLSGVSFTVGLGLDPATGSWLGSSYGAVVTGARCDDVFERELYPTELDSNGMVRCEMPGVMPSDGAFLSPSPAEEMAVDKLRWGVATIDGFTSAQKACCRCGSNRGGRSDKGGHYVRDAGVKNPGAGIQLGTTELAVPARGCKNGNVPVSLGTFELVYGEDNIDW